MDKKKVVLFIRNGLLIFVLFIAMVWANTYYRGRAQYMEGEGYFKAGKFKEAITCYGTSVRMYTPLAGYVPASLDRLWEMGEGYQNAGQLDWALIAYRDLRSSIYAIRSFYTPYEEWIARADERIDQVLALQSQKEKASETKSKEAAP